MCHMTKKHDNNAYKIALEKYNGWMSSKHSGSVTSQINKHVSENFKNNREALKSLVRCVLFCDMQDVGLRGHREFNNQNDTNMINNNGNFLQLVKLLRLENGRLDNNLNSLPKNSKYTSNGIQNDVIQASCDVVRKCIVKEIKTGNNMFSIIVDEARDASMLEQLTICLRYLPKYLLCSVNYFFFVPT